MLDGRGWAVSSRRMGGEVVGKKSPAKVRAGYFAFSAQIHSGRFLCGVGLSLIDWADPVAGQADKKTENRWLRGLSVIHTT